MDFVGSIDWAPAVFEGGSVSFAVFPVDALDNFNSGTFQFEEICTGFFGGLEVGRVFFCESAHGFIEVRNDTWILPVEFNAFRWV